MSKTFADHLLKKEEIHIHIDLCTSHPDQKKEINTLIEDIFTHHLLDTILIHLPKNYHDYFIELLKKDLSDPKILKFIKDNISLDIESEIKKMAEKLKKDLLSDIKKSIK